MKKFSPFLSVAFSGFLVYLFDKAIAPNIVWEKISAFKIGEWLNSGFQVRIFQLLLFLIFAVSGYFISNHIFKKKGIFTKQQKKLRLRNRKSAPADDMLFTWTVWFDDNDQPFIADLTVFCTNHGGVPLRFMHNRCPNQNCVNNNRTINPHLLKNNIESDLLNQWAQMQ